MTLLLFGYLSFLDNTPDVIINRPPLPGSKDYAMKIGKIIFFFNSILQIPFNFCPGKNEIGKMLVGTYNFDSKTNFFLTFIMLSIVTLIAVVYP